MVVPEVADSTLQQEVQEVGIRGAWVVSQQVKDTKSQGVLAQEAAVVVVLVVLVGQVLVFQAEQVEQVQAVEEPADRLFLRGEVMAVRQVMYRME